MLWLVDALPAWIEPFRADVEALARIEGEMPSKEQLFAFMDDLGGLRPEDPSIDEFSARWWRHFSALEIRRAQKTARLHVRLHALYRRLMRATDEELAAYAHLRERARTSAMKPLMADLLTRSRAADRDAAPEPP